MIDVYSFDLDSYKWTKIETKDTRPKIYHHRSLIYCDSMYLFGGFNGSYLNEVYKLDLSQEKHQSDSRKSFYELYEKRLFSDYKITIFDHEYHLNKCILSQNEKFLNFNFIDELRIREPKVLDNFIKYLYGEKIILNNDEIIIQLLRVANYFSLEDLESISLFSLYRVLTSSNFLKVLRMSIEYNLEELQNLCYYFAQKNQGKLSEKVLSELNQITLVQTPKLKFHLGNRVLPIFIENIYDTNEGSDVQIITENGDSFKTHKFMLTIYSDFFKRMFTSGFEESYQNEVYLPDISSHTLELILKFTYGKPVKFPSTISELISLVHFSDLYLFKDINTRATNELKKFITVETALEIVNQCVKFNIEGPIKENCWKIIKNSGVKEQLIECLFEMHLSNLQTSVVEQRLLKELEENVKTQKSNIKLEFQNMKQEIESLKKDNEDLKKKLDEQNILILKLLKKNGIE